MNGTSINELSQAILHQDATTGQFVNVTDPGYPDPIHNIVCGSVPGLSPFVVAVFTNIPGGGSAQTDCMSEWNAGSAIVFDRTGLPRNRVVCRDGDACDADGAADGKCQFRIDICPNAADARLPGCAPSDIARYTLAAPNPHARNLTNRTNAAAILTALANLQSTSPVSNEVIYNPPLTASTCASGVSIIVPRGAVKPGGKTIKLRAATSGGTVDTDILNLVCLP